MSNIYNDFEDKYKFSWFSAGWVEDEPMAKVEEKCAEMPVKKDLDTLEIELELIKDDIIDIQYKQIQLANLAKFYQ